jgi:hypothetical protein
MGWEERRGRLYYYKSERVGGRVRKVYLGNDEVARTLAEADATIRRVQEAGREARRARREEMDAEDAQLEELCELIELLTKGALLEVGYRKRKGEWRRKRAEKDRRQQEG